MNRLRVTDFGCADDAIDSDIVIRCLADANCFVGKVHVQRVGIFSSIDGYR